MREFVSRSVYDKLVLQDPRWADRLVPYERIPEEGGKMKPRCGKRPFLTKSAALGELGRAKGFAEAGIERRKEQRVYSCPVCGFYHLTSKSKTRKGAA